MRAGAGRRHPSPYPTPRLGRYASSPPWPGSVTPAASARPSARAARTPWSPPSGASTPNLQKVRITEGGAPQARVRLHALPEGRQGHQGLAAARPVPWPIRASSASAPSSRARSAQLEARREEVNDLNVFPVADGDTGDNMALTLRAVLDELDRLVRAGRRSTRSAATRSSTRVARAALLGARGNSGVILSQLIRGAAEELISPPGRARRPGADRRRDGARRRPGLRLGARAGRGHDPHRGARDGRTASRARSRTWSEPRLAAARRPTTQQDALIAEVLERALDAGQESVKRGPDLLPVLREAGVVDAGGYGLTDDVRRRRSPRCAAPSRRRSSTTRRRASPTRSTSPRPTATARTSPSPATDARRRRRGSRRSRRSATRCSSSATARR